MQLFLETYVNHTGIIFGRFENLWRHVISATGTVTDEHN